MGGQRIYRNSVYFLPNVVVTLKLLQDFRGGAEDKNLPANAGDSESIPGLGRFHIPRSN